MEKKIATEEIWIFIEKKFEAPVPAYIKNVLSVCGYNNGVSIGGIGDDDIQYMQDEVRNGNVEKVFEKSEIDYLEDCTKKKVDFEFVRGHKKYLMAIVGFLKNHLAENGPASFSLKEKPSKKKITAMKKLAEKSSAFPSRKKVVDMDLLVEYALATELQFQEKSTTISNAVLAEHRKVLLKKTINSLNRIVPKEFEKNIETIKKKISGDFMSFELDDDCEDSIAVIKCVFCTKTLKAFLRPTPSNEYLWKTSSFDRHLKIIHRYDDLDAQDLIHENVPESEGHDEQNEKMDALDRDRELKPTGNFEPKETLSDLTGAKVSESKSHGDVKVNVMALGKENDLSTTKYFGQEPLPLSVLDQQNKASAKTEAFNDSSNKLQCQIQCGANGHREETEKFREPCDDKPTEIKNTDETLEFRKCVPILKNGFKTRHGNEFIITTNTCAFDTIINTFASVYLDNRHVRKQIGSSGSRIADIIKSLCNQNFKSTSGQASDFKEVYAVRNIILKEIYTGWCKNSNVTRKQDTTFIDCTTGIGGLFARICLRFEEQFASKIENKNCQKCKTVHTRVFPFLKTTGSLTKSLTKINEFLDRSSTERLCPLCKNKCEVTTFFNNVVVLETEPPTRHQNHKFALQNVCPALHINNTSYLLCGVMHFDLKLNHFVAYTRRSGDSWKCLDDLKKTEQKVDPFTETSPFMVCYVASTHCTDFEKAMNRKKPVLGAAPSPNNNHSQIKHVPVSLTEPARLSVPYLAKLPSKKRKNRNSSKNRKRNKI